MNFNAFLATTSFNTPQDDMTLLMTALPDALTSISSMPTICIS